MLKQNKCNKASDVLQDSRMRALKFLRRFVDCCLENYLQRLGDLISYYFLLLEVRIGQMEA